MKVLCRRNAELIGCDSVVFQFVAILHHHPGHRNLGPETDHVVGSNLFPEHLCHVHSSAGRVTDQGCPLANLHVASEHFRCTGRFAVYHDEHRHGDFRMLWFYAETFRFVSSDLIRHFVWLVGKVTGERRQRFARSTAVPAQVDDDRARTLNFVDHRIDVTAGKHEGSQLEVANISLIVAVFVDGFLSVELLPYCVVVHEVPLAAPLNLEASPCIRRKLEGALRVATGSFVAGARGKLRVLPRLDSMFCHFWNSGRAIQGWESVWRTVSASELSQGDASIVRSTWL